MVPSCLPPEDRIAVSDDAVTALPRAFRDLLPHVDWAAPASPEARVLLIDVAQWRVALPAAALLLDAAESARVARKRFARDREMLVLAYAMHRLLLGAALGCAPQQVPLIRDERGCPQLPGTPWHTSLSHSDHAIAIAVSSAGAIGVDIEPTSRSQDMSGLAEHICHPNERHAMEDMPVAARELALLRLWVRKEALLKALGVGLAWEMSGFEAPVGMPVLLPNDINNVFHVIDLSIGEQWHAAVALAPGVRSDWFWLGSPPADRIADLPSSR